MKNVLVRDIMIYKVITASPTDSVIKVARILQKNKIHAMPVIDDANRVIGMVAETDFYLKNNLDFHLPTYINILNQNPDLKDDKSKKTAEIQKLLDTKVLNIMTNECQTVDENASINDLIQLFKATRLYTFPVVDFKKVLVGIVTMADVMKLL